MNIIEVNNQTNGEIDIALIKRTVNSFFKSHRLKNKEITVALVGDKTIKRLNKIYLGVNYATDVLAFPGEGNFYGEIVIDYQQIKRQAKRYNNTIKDELIFVLVHGLLHLIGYDDKTERQRKRMMKLAREFIGR